MSSGPAPPPLFLVDEIVSMTFQENCEEIIQTIDRKLNAEGKNWQGIAKALSLLHNCLDRGSKDIFLHFRNRMHTIELLQNFTYYDGMNQDRGSSIRRQAKNILDLLREESKWAAAQERSKARRNAAANLPHNAAIPSMSISPPLPVNTRRKTNSLPSGRNNDWPHSHSMSPRGSVSRANSVLGHRSFGATGGQSTRGLTLPSPNRGRSHSSPSPSDSHGA